MSDKIETPMIQLENIHKSFGSKKVLQGVDLSVPKGKSLVVLGGSGTGKSVTLKTILGLITPDQGSIKIDGQEILGLSEKKRDGFMSRIGMLFQGGALFDSLSVWENVAFLIRQNKSISKAEAKNIAIENLRQVGLDADVADLYPSELSGGMQKRVGLARAIAATPDIIFFDEPTTGLDPIMADIINDLIVTCSKKIGATTLTITHDMASARKIADYVAMIYEGKIIWTGTVEELDKSGNPYVDQFIHGRAEGPIKVSF